MKKSLIILSIVFLCFSFTQASASDFKVITFNTWLLEILGNDVASDIPERRERIIEALIELDADVISLQEVWPVKHRDFLIEHLSEHYPYCVFDDSKSGFFKLFADGLMIFSKHPIENHASHASQGCGRPSHTLRFSEYTRLDEAFISKGAIHVEIRHPQLGIIDVYNAHLGALNFDVEKNDYNPEHDRAIYEQADEFIYFVQNTISSSQAILAMDLNRHFKMWQNGFDSHDILGQEYQSIFASLGAIDTFMQANGFNPRTTSDIYTYDGRSNPNAAAYIFAGNPPAFIDYIFSIGDLLQPVESEIIFTQPFREYYLSDHYGLMTSFEITPNP